MNRIVFFLIGNLAFLSQEAGAVITKESSTLQVWADDITLDADGKTISTLKVYQRDVDTFTAFNMAFFVPRGVKIAKIRQGREWVDDIHLSARAASTHTIQCNMLEDSVTVKVISYSMNQDNYYPDDEDGNPLDLLFTIGFIAEPYMEDGTYPVEITDIKFVEATTNASVPENDHVWCQFTIEGGVTTGVESVEIPDALPDVYYDLSGRRVEGRPEPGFYIYNGQKVLVK